MLFKDYYYFKYTVSDNYVNHTFQNRVWTWEGEILTYEIRRMNIINLLDNLSNLGYDCIVNSETIIILFDGYVSELPINNITKLIDDPDLSNDEIILLIRNSHNVKKEIHDGKYDNLKPMTDDEITEKLKNIFKDKKNGRVA